MIALHAAEHALRRMDVVLRRRVDGLTHGDRPGRRIGTGGEVHAVRPYRPGEDDVRRMDWTVTARTGEPHVRVTVAEHELETWVLVDGSASMDFGTALMEKRDVAVAMVAAIGALTDRPGNRLGACVLTGDGLRAHRARTGRVATRALLRSLIAAGRPEPGPAAVADLGAGIERMRRERRRPGLRVVVSDFIDPPPGWEPALRRLAARHDVIAVEVVDPREERLPDVGLLTLVDPETGRRREVHTGSARLRARFASEAAAHRTATTAAVRRTGAAHLVLRTDRDWVGDVARFVVASARARRRRAR
ncbi:DUF58 domain-containing protein [Pseudonocardia sp. TRM90224]|uniref:DUF58 domain-containing protein n=1 Tax=Pseudonocardia sp. TRM90224 TaxID=2812678 RepID=UPI001E553484|nr:DUF58 domain-containing protein [Pseudonocardia sp. TRM90224]